MESMKPLKNMAWNLIDGSQILWTRNVPLEAGITYSQEATRPEAKGAYQCRGL